MTHTHAYTYDPPAPAWLEIVTHARAGSEVAQGFTSVDPLTSKFPWYTPYQFAGNMPIIAKDLDGLEPDISTTAHDIHDGSMTVQVVSDQQVDPNGHGAISEAAKWAFRTGSAFNQYVSKNPEVGRAIGAAAKGLLVLNVAHNYATQEPGEATVNSAVAVTEFAAVRYLIANPFAAAVGAAGAGAMYVSVANDGYANLDNGKMSDGYSAAFEQNMAHPHISDQSANLDAVNGGGDALNGSFEVQVAVTYTIFAERLEPTGMQVVGYDAERGEPVREMMFDKKRYYPGSSKFNELSKAADGNDNIRVGVETRVSPGGESSVTDREYFD